MNESQHASWIQHLGNTYDELESMTKGNSVRLKDSRKAGILINDIKDMSSEVPFKSSIINLTNEVASLVDNISAAVVGDSIFTQNKKYLIAGFILAIVFVFSCLGCLWLGYSLGEEHMHNYLQIIPHPSH